MHFTSIFSILSFPQIESSKRTGYAHFTTPAGGGVIQKIWRFFFLQNFTLFLPVLGGLTFRYSRNKKYYNTIRTQKTESQKSAEIIKKYNRQYGKRQQCVIVCQQTRKL